MVEKGIVESIEEGWISVQCSENPYCASCNACESGKDSVKRLKVKNPDNISIEKGDIVEVYLSPGKSILASFMVFIMPIILFFIFYFLAGSVIKGASEKVQVLSGLLGIALGFIINMIYGKIRKDSDLPEITRVLSKDVSTTFYADT